MVKKQISFIVDEKTAKNLERIREETGIPISKQVELALKGYKIIKKKNQKIRRLKNVENI